MSEQFFTLGTFIATFLSTSQPYEATPLPQNPPTFNRRDRSPVTKATQGRANVCQGTYGQGLQQCLSIGYSYTKHDISTILGVKNICNILALN